MKTRSFLILCMLSITAIARGESLTVPAFTAYVDPVSSAGAVRVSARRGITGWSDPALQVLWFGEFKQAGALTAKVVLRLPQGGHTSLRLSVGGQAHLAGAGPDTPATADFGSFTIAQPGYVKFALSSLNPPGQPCGEIETLVLDGPALAGAHFNLKERRNAASVHLFYPTPKEARIDWFYNEVTAVKDPVATFYMACGFRRGYFGMQVNGPAERRIIFSVWDSGGEPVSRDNVAAENRVQLISKGEGVYAGDFGHEGTGGHSHLVYPWKTGQPQRFLLAAKPVNADHTMYAGYWFHPDQKKWMLIAMMKAPKDGGWLGGLHSFSENFGGANGHLQRKALYGNQWIHLAGGDWHELTQASFSCDGTGKADRFDRFMGVENGQFFLAHGGFVEGFTPFGKLFTRPKAKLPEDLNATITRLEKFIY